MTSKLSTWATLLRRLGTLRKGAHGAAVRAGRRARAIDGAHAARGRPAPGAVRRTAPARPGRRGAPPWTARVVGQADRLAGLRRLVARARQPPRRRRLVAGRTRGTGCGAGRGAGPRVAPARAAVAAL